MTDSPAPSASAPVIRAEGLEKTFRDFWKRPKVRAVRGIGFEVRPGEVFGLLGPNGSGKSTTIKMILGLLHPTAGSLSVLGQPPRDVAVKRRLGYLPEESYLYPYLTAEETLHFYGKLFDLSPPDRRTRVDQLLDMVGLTQARHRHVGEFSKGMARRIGLAQALINDPDLVILDEPTSGLDPLGSRQVKDVILALARRGKTVLVSSHLLADMEDVCDRIAILFNGQIQATGPIGSLLEQSDQIQIRFPRPAEDRLAAVLAELKRAAGGDPEVRQPRMNLEQFFLDTVARARESATEVSGAAPDGKLARFLEHTAKEPE